jgi:molecular chaperone DnaK (HSP70)
VRLLNEPTAIAIARWHPASVHESNVMVVDVGAAALQASLITVDHGVYEVRRHLPCQRDARLAAVACIGPLNH